MRSWPRIVLIRAARVLVFGPGSDFADFTDFACLAVAPPRCGLPGDDFAFASTGADTARRLEARTRPTSTRIRSRWWSQRRGVRQFHLQDFTRATRW